MKIDKLIGSLIELAFPGDEATQTVCRNMYFGDKVEEEIDDIAGLEELLDEILMHDTVNTQEMIALRTVIKRKTARKLLTARTALRQCTFQNKKRKGRGKGRGSTSM